jgi:hypothetical protein
MIYPPGFRTGSGFGTPVVVVHLDLRTSHHEIFEGYIVERTFIFFGRAHLERPAGDENPIGQNIVILTKPRNANQVLVLAGPVGVTMTILHAHGFLPGTPRAT